MTLSYVLGFTAAFIAYGIAHTTLTVESEPAAVAKTSLTVLQNADERVLEAADKRVATGIRYDDHLYAIIDGEDVLISADDAHGEGRGFHHTVSSFELVNGGEEIRFCVFETIDDKSCTAAAYDVSNHSVQFWSQ